MSRWRPNPKRTPYWLRLSVVIGGCALLLGLIGAVVLVVRDEERQPDWGPGLRPHLTLTGLEEPALENLQVSVSWFETENAAQVRQEAEAVVGSPGSFRLPPDAFGRTVELEILRDRVLLLRKAATVHRGEPLTVSLAGTVRDGGGDPPR